MGVFRPLRAVLFVYEILRILLLVVFLYIAPSELSAPVGNDTSGAFFPYLVFLSANALFPLMALFVWLRPEEYRNYLTLYIAGKIIGVVSFYAWEFFSSREFPGAEYLAKSMVLLGGSVFVSLADILSVWGAWTLKNKFRQALGQPLSGGVDQAAGRGGPTESGGV